MADPSRIAVDELCKLTGLTDHQLQVLARQGLFPPAKKGSYELKKALQGLFTHYRKIEEKPFACIAYSTPQAAQILGWPEGKLRDCKKAGCPAFKHSRIYIDELIQWIGTADVDDWGGEYEKQRARDMKGSADARERDNKIAAGDLIPKSDYDGFCQRILLPLRQCILAAPSQLANRVNPTDPAFAQTALEEWRKETLTLLRTEIQKA